jgi:RNA polymerase sigma-70 factor (ECF subfamily)
MAGRDEFLKRLLQHEADLRAFIGSLVRDRHACDDVFQEVAVVLWQQAEAYDPRRSFGAWARGIAANKVLQRRHQDRRFPLVFSPETIQAVLDAFGRTEDAVADRRDALAQCLKRLPELPRRLLALRYGEGLAVEAIARQMNRTLDAIYQALSRTRAALQECIRRRLAAARGGH